MKLRKLQFKKSLPRLFIALITATLMGTILLTAVPHSVSAAGDKEQQLQKEARIYALYTGATNCSTFLDDFTLGANDDRTASNLYNEMYDAYAPPETYTVFFGGTITGDGSSPSLDCDDDGSKIFSALGFKEVAQVIDVFYTKDGNDYSVRSDANDRLKEYLINTLKVEVGPDNDITRLSDGAKYYYYLSELKSMCGLSSKAVSTETYNLADADKKAQIWTIQDGKVSKEQEKYTISKQGFRDEDVESGRGFSCIDALRTLSTDKKLVEAYIGALTTDGNTTSDSDDIGDNAASGDPDAAKSCESEGGDESWFMCPALRLVGGALEILDRTLASLLSVDRDKYGDNINLYNAWASFRNIALTLLIAAMLVMVISTALGVSFLDAYTVKKAFPRMVASVIFILLSWYFCVFMIDISNTVGRGTLGIMLTPFPSAQEGSTLASMFVPSGGGEAITIVGGVGLLVGAIGVTGGISLMLSWLATGMLVMAIAFLVLIARQMFIVVLILFAPVAILAWIFPGNDKMWKFWWQTFSKLLLMFPMVMALIGSGRIFASVWQTIPGAGLEAIINPLLKITAYILPYAFIPFTFKAAGGVFGNLVGMANDRSRGAFDRLKKGRQKTGAEMGQRMGAGQGFRGGQKNPFSRGLNTAGSTLAAGPKGWVGPGSTQKRRGIRETRMAALGASSTKDNEIYQANKNNDMFLLAAADETMAKSKIAAAERKALTATNAGDRLKYQQEADARKRALGMAQAMPNRNSATQRQAAMDLAATGYQFSQGQDGYNELAAMSRRINGNDDAAHAAFMNNAQYNLKGAGRFDLAGINNGAGYDPGKGLEKASLYELANSKGDSIGAFVDSIPAGPAGQEAAVAYSELQSMRPNAKGGTLKAIDAAIADLETRGVQQYMSAAGGTASGRMVPDPNNPAGPPVQATKTERVDYDSARAAADPAYAAKWSPAEAARGWQSRTRVETRADLVHAQARTYQPPDPNREV